MGIVGTLACDKKDEAKSAPPPVVGADRSGVLKQGDFRFRCVGPNDAYCGDPGLFGPSMPRFGVGASAQFQFVPKGSQDALPVRDVVSRARLRLDDQGLVTPLAEGRAGILANSGKDGALTDVRRPSASQRPRRRAPSPTARATRPSHSVMPVPTRTD
jgi:hypothetical protein